MRDHRFDICRVFACMAVVMIHTVMLFWEFDPASSTWAVYNFIAVAIRCGVPLFFMISGALLLQRQSLDLKKHLKRTWHFVLLYFVWSFICAFVDCRFFHVWYQGGDFAQLIFGSYYHLWYLPAMILCYLFLPLLHAFIYRDFSKPNYAFALFCLLAALVLLPLLSNKPEWLSLLLEHFQPENLRYLVYMLLGWWLCKHRPGTRALALLALASAAAVILFAWLNRRYSISIGEPSTRFYDYMSPAMLLLSGFVFSLCMRIDDVPGRLRPLLQELSDCTLGVYLMHPLFISGLKSLGLDFTQFNTFVFFPLCYLAFLLLPLALSFTLRRVPGIRRLIK